ncbi:hypothetical protein BUALT_Bualt18G0121700 [Buddleja alternifolia]|uniref:Pre-mRNA-processing factor 39 n=1 Tax=Buddleja alternifolia TaxID=168488 RepID=A0AAV6W331_9LAMI|nr:hypothetical protein BUALT_Bualt18G0121700 [Buddleja alternifolia]
MAAAPNSNAANATSLAQKLNKMIAGGSLNYNSWRSLILEFETASPEDIDNISLAYDSFLSVFPLCHWHLEKYAYHKAKLCGSEEAIKVYERGAGVAMFSVGFWVDYFTFGAVCFGDPEDVRRLFGRAFSFVGKDYFCHALWDKYMKYEFSQEGWSFLAQGYIQALKFPTKKLHFYYDNFKQFVANLEEEIGYEKNDSVEVEQVTVPCAAVEVSNDKISLVIEELLGSADKSLKSKALDKYRSIGEEFYQEACQVDEKIKCFERNIRRQYFSVTPLDVDQLNNWHLYLDFIEKQDNLDWAVKLYERCLIPCANYPEFWMRYVEFLESKGGCEMAISALDRATQIFLKNEREIHLFNARFKEHIGDVNGARSALLMCDTNTDSAFIEKVVLQANMERRLGNFAAATVMYEKALETAIEKQKLHILPGLYSHCSRLTFLITGNVDAARDVLIDGLRHVPRCRFLLEELIKFAMMHEGGSQINVVDSIIADAISPGSDEYEGFTAKDREDISCLFLEFVNLCGTVQDVRKTWNRHVKLFPHLLRIKTTYKHPTSGKYLLDKKQSYELAVHDQPLGKETVVLSDENASRGNEIASTELSNQSKEIVLSMHDSDHDLPHQIKPGPMDVSVELANETRENALSPSQSAHEVGNLSGTTNKSVEASHPGLNYVRPELDHEIKQQKQSVSLDTISLNSHNEPERDGSVGHQNNTPTKIHCQSDLGPLQEDKVTDQARPVNMMETPNSFSTGQPTPSPSPVPYPQENMNQITSLGTQQHPWQANPNVAMNQMLQYYYQQQQYQQQYQYYYNQQAYQQQYVQQQQLQSSPYQNLQAQQGPGPQMNFQPGHEKQYNQCQEQAAYQAHQLGYQQQAAQGQQLLLQQYQQYQQGYQQQQQSHEGHLCMQEQQMQPHPQNTSQIQQVPKTAPADYDGASEPSVSHVQSPQAVQ